MERLREYDIDPVRGFLPPTDPLERLPPGFEAWESLAPRVSGLLLAGQLRSVLAAVPIPDLERLESIEELERAMLLLSVFGNAYVWAQPEEPARVIPRSVAKPWCEVAAKLDRPPIVAHASLVLRNWRRIDPAGRLTLDNLETLQRFGGAPDEQWFFLIPVAMESRGAEALVAIMRARDALVEEGVNELCDELETMARVTDELTDILARTPEACDPYIFYRRVRPYLAGWPEPGVVYEGVSEEPVRLAGGSAAQSSLFQSLDAALGVVHDKDASRPFLQAMRGHMPPGHRRFIQALENGPSIRSFVLEHRTSHPKLAGRYDAAVRALDRFRGAHFEIAIRYVTREAPQPEAARGTGGTELATFLRTTREETRAKLLDHD